MKSKHKILVCGVGSIGSRHISNLLTLGEDILSLVTKRKEFPENWPRLEVFESLTDALDGRNYSHALICTPTSQHREELSALIEAGVANIYLEKPVGHSIDGFEVLLRRIGEGQRIIVGYDLRFDPGLNFVRELIASGRFGRILAANAFVGQYLPNWRPHEDYRKGSSALKAKGGGVLLDLVHEFDYLYWLLGRANAVGAFYQQNPELDIETEDLADVLIKFDSGATATVHLDYHQRILERFCVVTCTRGSIRWDLAQRKVAWVEHSGEVGELDFSEAERNERFVSIMSAFLSGVSDERMASFEDGIASLKMVLAAKKSSESHTFVAL
ncbi:Gfo/Idh/MocA family oxidoreductase [Algoriphagus aestuariicola]|uniref:Gfo/Idh/MocA family oxidoreductase n=1 Tax=Algoriphagus aestuariicola TaxID=1852016 RepID=A0ABS3BLU6_9BACT|nr:Gfo/Idh/MocA family oxidoreductase [Algoriphagus aestuariicola]MBN7799921.1 Gfo/Idh/MocA family oxidoreductase [Algoriphagus aestuariicola]